jgi:hypothetical protein
MLLSLSLMVLAQMAGRAAPAAEMPVLNPNANQPANCPATSRYQASRRGKTPKAQKLNELPAADAYSAVYRRIGQCEVPIMVKYGVGGR